MPETWQLGFAVADLVRRGTFDRAEVIDAALEILERSDKVSAQRATASILSALEFEASDIEHRIPSILECLPTVDGSLTLLLVPLLVERVSGRDIVRLTEIVVARPEKKQKAILRKAIGQRDAADRYGANELETARALATSAIQ